MSLTITFTNLVFSVLVQSAPSVDGPWNMIGQSDNPCASTHSLSVNKTEPMQFFRFIPLDNGVAPTPQAPELYNYLDKVRAECPPIYECGYYVLEYRWHSDGVLVATSTEPAVFINATPGTHLYQVQIRTTAGLSWLSKYSTIDTLAP